MRDANEIGYIFLLLYNSNKTTKMIIIEEIINTNKTRNFCKHNSQNDHENMQKYVSNNEEMISLLQREQYIVASDFKVCNHS